MPASKANNGYKGGPLPGSCPPADAVNVPAGYLFRLVPKSPSSADDFRSGHAEGKTQPRNCDLCRWMSCSVWAADTPLENIAGLTKLKNLSHMKFIARFKVDGTEGKVKPHDTDPKHLSFWMLESFDPTSTIDKYESV